jgi:sugar transferase EpsL
MSMRPTFYRRGGKRLLDIVVSALALVTLAPVLLLLAVLVLGFLGAPVLFRQRRSGLGLRPFMILKFRTMTEERDPSGALLSDSQRLTPFGRFLRLTSLDELPELWNVLKGEMSLVGPRPLLPQYDSYYSEQELRRFDLLPGITGWAQINGRNDLAWDDRLECDAWYAEKHCFGLDLKILCITVLKVLRRDNIQADPGETFGAFDEERRERLAALAANSPLPCTRGRGVGGEEASCSPLPCTRGRGVGGEGANSPENPAPSPQPLSPEYRGEGLAVQTLTEGGQP